MSKLNTPKKSISQKLLTHPDITRNDAGGIAFKANNKTDLMIRVISSLISEDGFYKSGRELDSDLRNSIAVVAKEDPAFILKLAKYARKDLNLRTAPVVLMGEFGLSGTSGSVPGARHAIADIISRADEITELLSYVMEQNKSRNVFRGKVPMVIKHGVADAFNKFNAYNFAKYYGRDKEISMRDALFITHPVPINKEQEHVFAEIASDELKPADTWEVALSTKGASKEVWEEVIEKWIEIE
jgi:hypothetical protein